MSAGEKLIAAICSFSLGWAVAESFKAKSSAPPVPPGWVRRATETGTRVSRTLHPTGAQCPACAAEAASR